ncbi:MAG: hypothetical protein WBG86_04475 [Polyangiales bacterium]
MKQRPWYLGFVILALIASCGGSSGAADACESFCATLDECGFGLFSGPCDTECAVAVQASAEVSNACANAFQAEGECVGALSCAQLEAWIDDTPDSPCVAEDAAVTAACSQ